jgi:HPt (histidine-containing phosphotransfer) domain-containing protein
MNHSAAAADRRGGKTFEPVMAPSLVPDVLLIDLDHLGRMTLGERDLEREVLQLFEQQAAMLLHRMTVETPRTVAALAHTMVGSARGIGAWKVADAAAAVQGLADGPGPARLTAAMNRLSAAVAETQSAIAERLRESVNASI